MNTLSRKKYSIKKAGGLAHRRPVVLFNGFHSKLADGQPVLYHGQLLYFKASSYLPEPEQLWQLGAIVGDEQLTETSTMSQLIDAEFIEGLLRKLSFSLYLSADGQYLVANDDELSQHDFGPLNAISVEEAGRRFTISAVEQAIERTAFRI